MVPPFTSRTHSCATSAQLTVRLARKPPQDHYDSSEAPLVEAAGGSFTMEPRADNPDKISVRASSGRLDLEVRP